jgi:phosphocarrier protein NPr
MKLRKLVEIRNKLGIHARPAMKLFELVQSFDAVVTLRNQSGTEADASSVIAMLMLDSAQGGWIEVQVEGRQQEEAMQAVVELFNSKFDEE